MEEYTVIKTVTFSGKFQLVLTDADLEYARVLVADVEVTRRPQSPYFSTKTFPPNGFLGAACVLSGGFVTERIDVEYEKQRFIFHGSADEQDIPTQVCLAAIAASNLQALAIALGTVLSVGSSPYAEALTPSRLFPQILQFKCYADTALTVSVQVLKYENCTGTSQPPPPPPKPPAPPPAPQIPPGTPIPPEIYSPNEGDPSSYEPFPLDEPEEPVEPDLPFGEECEPYLVAMEISGISGGGGEPQIIELSVWGVVEEKFERESLDFPGIFEVGVICGRNIFDPCVPGTPINFATSTNPDLSGFILSITPI